MSLLVRYPFIKYLWAFPTFSRVQAFSGRFLNFIGYEVRVSDLYWNLLRHPFKLRWLERDVDKVSRRKGLNGNIIRIIWTKARVKFGVDTGSLIPISLVIPLLWRITAPFRFDFVKVSHAMPCSVEYVKFIFGRYLVRVEHVWFCFVNQEGMKTWEIMDFWDTIQYILNFLSISTYIFLIEITKFHC